MQRLLGVLGFELHLPFLRNSVFYVRYRLTHRTFINSSHLFYLVEMMGVNAPNDHRRNHDPDF